MKYICPECGKEHDEWPALTFNAPAHYYSLSEDEQDTIADINSDFCNINYGEQIGRFIRVSLEQKVIDSCIPLTYGVWVSLSEKSYKDYYDSFENQNYQPGYFGYLANDIPDYTSTINIHMNVFTQTGGLRPYIIPHFDFDHPFVRDYYSGITFDEAERRINDMMKA